MLWLCLARTPSIPQVLSLGNELPGHPDNNPPRKGHPRYHSNLTHAFPRAEVHSKQLNNTLSCKRFSDTGDNVLAQQPHLQVQSLKSLPHICTNEPHKRIFTKEGAEMAQWLRALGFGSQHRHGGSQPPITLVPRDQASSSGLFWVPSTRVVHRQTRGQTFICTQRINRSLDAFAPVS